MRILDANLKTETQKKITRPVWLFEIDLGASTIRASDREDITWNSQTWLSWGSTMEGITNDSLAVGLDNSGQAISSLALGNDVVGNSMKAWLYYGGYAQLRFDGIMDYWETEAGSHRVSFIGSSDESKAGKFPPDIITEGLWNHIPPPGTTIMAGTQPIVLEAE